MCHSFALSALCSSLSFLLKLSIPSWIVRPSGGWAIVPETSCLNDFDICSGGTTVGLCGTSPRAGSIMKITSVEVVKAFV